MSNFIPRLSKYVPSDMTWTGSLTDANKWWYDPAINPGADNVTCLPNCTTFCFGRSCEICGAAVGPYAIVNRPGFGNASSWYNDTGSTTWERGQVPKLGAIVCWSDSVSRPFGGHVAIIEDMADGDPANIILSMSAYQSASTGSRSFSNPGAASPYYFYTMTLADARNRYEVQSDCTLQGYIYNPYVQDEDYGGLSLEELCAVAARKRKRGTYEF